HERLLRAAAAEHQRRTHHADDGAHGEPPTKARPSGFEPTSVAWMVDRLAASSSSSRPGALSASQTSTSIEAVRQPTTIGRSHSVAEKLRCATTALPG